MHLADGFIQSDLLRLYMFCQYVSVIHIWLHLYIQLYLIGIVTRCPLELRLKKCGVNWKAALSYRDKKKEFVDISLVENYIEEGLQSVLLFFSLN